MKICRYLRNGQQAVSIGVMHDDGTISDVSAHVPSLFAVLEAPDPQARLSKAVAQSKARARMDDVTLCPPVERQEVWAAGVTYLRSKTARMEESDFSASAYDRVYDAERPEIFFKAIAEKVVPSGDAVGIRADARWNVPEPELALVINSRGSIAGYTIGNDMSSRDIEGENLLYLAQAKVYDRSCSIGPCILIGPAEAEVRDWPIRLGIFRDGESVFSAETSIGNIRRDFNSLAHYLFRSQRFPHGVVLLTGTGIVPADTFTLHAGDVVEIDVPRIGKLRNTVAVV